MNIQSIEYEIRKTAEETNWKKQQFFWIDLKLLILQKNNLYPKSRVNFLEPSQSIQAMKSTENFRKIYNIFILVVNLKTEVIKHFS